MASKSKTKTKSPTGDSKPARRSAKSRSAKSSNKDEAKAETEPTLAFVVLSSSQTKDLVELETVDDVQAKLAEIMETPLHSIELKDAVLLDYYTGALWWGRKQNFTIEQLSVFFTVVHILIRNVQERQLTLIENLKELKKLLTGKDPDGTDSSTGGAADCFTVDQLKLVTDYTRTSVFQHYKMFEYMFSTSQAEEIIGTDLQVEIAPFADVPWPPPLEEAIEENIHKEYVSPTGTSPREDQETEGKTSQEETAVEQAEAAEVEIELSEKETDILSQLTADEIKNIMTSVMEEMVQGVQCEVAQKLRAKEAAFLHRINKLHKVEDKK